MCRNMHDRGKASSVSKATTISPRTAKRRRNKAESRALINLLIKEIVLYNDKIEIHYNNPTTKSPDESQGFLFYSDKGKIVSEIQNKKPLVVKITIEMYLL